MKNTSYAADTAFALACHYQALRDTRSGSVSMGSSDPLWLGQQDPRARHPVLQLLLRAEYIPQHTPALSRGPPGSSVSTLVEL